MAKDRVERDEEDLVRLYLTDIGQYPLLTKDDEVRLAQEIEIGIEARGIREAGELPDGSVISAAKNVSCVNPTGLARKQNAPLSNQIFVLLCPSPKNIRLPGCLFLILSKRAT